ncbi:hypothetical protein KVV02_002883 [Mortierella alpina]|uniref:Exonuclease domain-containing protein n=1 Tax=Mortierella alpina TaxID=64518 RepID=A0A9P8A964_MORAP|nr:hypothetical protein KVV02_002883 [Mortierella alpina]
MVDKKRKHKAKHEWVEKSLVEDAESSQPVDVKDSSIGVGIVAPSSFDILLDMPADEGDNGEAVAEAKSHSDGEDSEILKRRKIERSSKDSDIVECSDVTTLSKKERKLLKKKNKQFAKKSEGDNGRPSFMLSRDHNKLSIKDLRDLVVYLLMETPTLPWIMVKNKFNIEKVVLLYVAGLDPQLFNVDLTHPDSRRPIAWAERVTKGPATEFQHLRKFFDVMNVIKAGGDKFRVHSPPNTLLNVPLSNSEKQKREKELKKKSQDAQNLTAEHYLIRTHDLREADYPLPSYLDPNAEHQPGWTETEQTKPSDPPVAKKMIAMDCEMVRTTAGSELTRVTLVDEEGKAIYDQLVMPDNPVVDYLTQYSGMTAERLEGVTTRLADVQRKLQELVTHDTILVGHSLENDMKVLKHAHPFIIDTAMVYHHTRGPPFRPSLKWLAQKWLSKKIQTGGELGHDSEEDARTCMELVRLKVEKGPGFGEYNQDQESIFSRLDRHTKPRTSAFIDVNSHSGEHATTVFKPANDAEVVEAISGALSDHDFVWARLRDMEINHGKIATVDVNEAEQSIAEPNQPFTRISSADKVQAAEEEIREAIQSVDRSIAAIVESLPLNTALLVTSGQGDHREVSRMQARQKHFQKLYNTLSLSAIPKEEQFLDEDQKALEQAVDRAKNGVCFFMVK